MNVLPVPDADAVTHLRQNITGALALPGEPGYELSTPWNVSVPMSPAAVVAPANAEDVAAAVQWASTQGLRVAVQTTGHSAVPYGEDVLMIHTGRLQECTIDVEQRIARVGAGVTSQQLVTTAEPYGLAPLVGTAGDVGFVGFLSGGGINPMVSIFGLSSDHVRSIEVVSGQGEIYHVTEAEHQDLFWGLRGSKGNLGIITSVEIECPQMTEFFAGALYFDGADFDRVLRAWAQWSEGLPPIAATAFGASHLPDLPFVPKEMAGRFIVAVRFASPAAVADAERLLKPMRAVAETINDTVAVRPYSDITSIYDEPTVPVPSQKGLSLLDSLPKKAVDGLTSTAGPDSESPMLLVEVRRLGGALANNNAAPSAFSHRDAAYLLHTVGLNVPPNPEVVAAAGDRIHESVRPWALDGVFANFLSSTDQDRIKAAYDDVSLRRLQALIQEYDPHGTMGTVGHLAR